MNGYLAGKLLVSTPALADPNFHGAVVLVCDHDPAGALGVILNRPTVLDVADYLPSWVKLLSSPRVVFEGGPVQREMAVGLAERRSGLEGTGWIAVAKGLGLLDLSLPADEVGDEVAALRVFSGYAGWGPDQLEMEVSAGDWFVVPADPTDPFTIDPEHLWRDVLRRQAGRLAMFAHFPRDTSLN